MKNIRLLRAKLNIVSSLGTQIVALFCGLVIPRMMIGAFGSELYGATASIGQFLAYISLFEGGIGGVARAALYGPIAQNDVARMSAIVSEIKRFFRLLAYAFVAYVIILGVSFKSISHIQSLDWISTFLLVVVISISTFGQYFIGISNSVFLQAAQKTYITNAITMIATVLNTVLVILLVRVGCNIIVVKLVSSCVFVLRPIFLWLYVKKSYKLTHVKKTREVYLKQKRTGMGQHLAFFLHSNTDVMVLTWFADLASVAVYSVYHMVISQIQNLTTSFASGMEAIFGDMLAKNEYDELNRCFGYYETLISIVSTVLFSATAVLILPFVKLYTRNVSDANYIVPLFAIILTLASLVYCWRIPYHSMTIAAGHFKETRVAAYGEAVINVGLSILLVHFGGLVGVAIATLVATMFRFFYYAIYLSKKISCRKISAFLKRISINIVAFAIIFLLGRIVTSSMNMENYAQWALGGIVVTAVAVLVTLILNGMFYRSDFVAILNKILKKAKIKRLC